MHGDHPFLFHLVKTLPVRRLPRARGYFVAVALGMSLGGCSPSHRQRPAIHAGT